MSGSRKDRFDCNSLRSSPEKIKKLFPGPLSPIHHIIIKPDTDRKAKGAVFVQTECSTQEDLEECETNFTRKNIGKDPPSAVSCTR